jgi:hypothetical protein
MPRASQTSNPDPNSQPNPDPNSQPNPEPAEGQVPAGDYDPVPASMAETPEGSTEEGTKTIEEVAQEVIAGHWGRGQRRRKDLAAAGYDVFEVDQEVSKIFNK